MSVGVPVFIVLLLISLGFIAVGWFMPYQLASEASRRQLRPWLIEWSMRGVVVPATLWLLMNVGVSWSLQPFMPSVQATRGSGGAWVPEFLRVVGIGLFIVSSYWAAVTLGWMLVRTGQAAQGAPAKDFKALCWTCLAGLILPAVIVLLVGGLSVLGLAALVILVPLAGYAPAMLHPKKMPPMYARAVARMKFGKYTEAEWEIIRELERHEDDFEGWMMLAELYANQFNDLPEAERTILEICDQPKVTPPQLSIALHRLADWNLKLAEDPDATRRALQMLCDRLRGTHLAHMAQLRIKQLPKTVEELRQNTAHRAIPLPALSEQLDESPPPAAASALEKNNAAKEANACVETLKLDPDDVAARERLARIFTERLGRPELGIEQVLLLVGMPDQPEGKRAEWLGIAAAWHLRYRHDVETGRKLLEKLLQEFPETPQALAARRRLELIAREQRC